MQKGSGPHYVSGLHLNLDPKLCNTIALGETAGSELEAALLALTLGLWGFKHK